MKTSHGLSFVACLMIVGAGTLSAAGGGAGQVIGVAGSGTANGVGASATASAGHATAPTAVRGGAVSTAGPVVGNHLGGAARPGVSVGGGISTARTYNNPAASTAHVAPTVPAARVHNAWSDPASVRTSNATGWIRTPDRDRNRGNFTGTVLYPNAGRTLPGDRRERGPGYTAGSGDNRWQYGDRFRHRGGYRCNPYIYGYPGVLIGGYFPYFYGDVASSYGDVADLGTDVAVSNAPTPAAVDAISQPYPNGSAVIQPPADPADDNNTPQAAAPATSNLQSNNGPDSLVEAVQAELSRRGYFGGKIDAIYNEATHAAIQRFQQDQKLPASGRINEATLHALQLD